MVLYALSETTFLSPKLSSPIQQAGPGLFSWLRQESKREWKKEMLLEAQSRDWHTIISASSYWSKQVTRPAQIQGIEEKQSTFWWEGLQTLITKSVANGEDGECGLLLQLI